MPLVTTEVRGKQETWGINWHASQEQIDAMWEDGVEVWEIENQIPLWVAEAGLTRPWCILQDLWNLKNPWGK